MSSDKPSYKRYKRGNLIGDAILNRIVSESYQRGMKECVPIILNWRDIVGDEVAKLATPVKLSKSILYLATNDYEFFNNFLYIKKDITTKIYNVYPNLVSDIKIKLLE